MNEYIAIITNVNLNKKKYDGLFGIDYDERVIHYENVDSVIKYVLKKGFSPSLILIDAIEKTECVPEIIKEIQDTYFLVYIPVIIAGPDDDINFEKQCFLEWKATDYMPYSTIDTLLSLHASVHIQRFKWAFIDEMTELYSRRYYEMIKTRVFQFCTGFPISLCIIDIDFFKQFNDRYGHQEGDDVIKFVAASIKKVVFTDGFVVRLGGDEFIIVLPKINEEKVKEIANKVVESVRHLKIKHEGRLDKKEAIVTVSVGATTGYIESKTNDNDDLYKGFIKALTEKADKNLYKIKKEYERDGFFYEIFKE